MRSLKTIDELTDEVRGHRQPQHGVSPLFLNRWSPRAFSDRKVSDEELYAVLEAAHWAPSSFNDQPWRFIVAKTEEQLRVFRSFLGDFNKQWADRAPVLIVLASDKLRANGEPNGAHAFDAGAAWASLALQATMKGLSAHAIGGFDREQARQALAVPDRYELHAVIALGYRGDKNSLPERIREREVPSGRKPLSEVVFEGRVNS